MSESLTAADLTRFSRSLGKLLLHLRQQNYLWKKKTKNNKKNNNTNFNLVKRFCQLAPGPRWTRVCKRSAWTSAHASVKLTPINAECRQRAFKNKSTRARDSRGTFDFGHSEENFRCGFQETEFLKTSAAKINQNRCVTGTHNMLVAAHLSDLFLWCLLH